MRPDYSEQTAKATSFVERTAEAPASTDGANLKLQGQSLALTPVASSGSAMCSFLHKSLHRECTAKYTKRNPWRGRYTSGLQAQQELTEETEGRVSLRYLCCLLFKSPSVARSRRTTSVSHGRQPPLAHECNMTATAASRWLHALVSGGIDRV